MKLELSNNEILTAMKDVLRELESQKYALDQSAIVAITDVKGDIIYVNEQFCAISKYTEDELLGKNHRIINSGHHPKSFFSEMWSTIAGGNVWRGDIQNRAKDGSNYWVATTVTPYLNEHNQPTMFVSIRFDITKQKQLEYELEEKLRENNDMLLKLSVKNTQLEDFCYIITHDLRSPVANMSMLCQLIESEDNMENILECLDKVKKVSEYLSETLEALIDTIQVASGYNIEVKNVNISDTFDRVLDSLQGGLIDSKAYVLKDFTEINCIDFHPQYLNSILLNLVSNSIKYRSLERKLEIRIKTFTEGKWTVMEYSDNGLGLDLVKVGDSFFKFKKTFHSHPNSKGIGMYLVKLQIEAMGGSINVSGALDQGLSYKMYLKKN